MFTAETLPGALRRVGFSFLMFLQIHCHEQKAIHGKVCAQIASLGGCVYRGDPAWCVAPGGVFLFLREVKKMSAMNLN